MDWIYYNLIILITWCKRPYKNLDKALLFSRNQVFWLKIWKLWQAPTTLQFNIFCWNFAHVLHFPMSTKKPVEFFLFYLDLELFEKVKKDLVSTHSVFTLLLITQDLNKIKKSPTCFFIHYQAQNVGNISAKNIKLYGSWSSLKFSIFQTKILVSWK